MCDKCEEFRSKGLDLPRRLPEHRVAFLEGEIVIFETLSRGLLAYVEGDYVLAVVDPGAKHGLQDEVLYIKSR